MLSIQIAESIRLTDVFILKRKLSCLPQHQQPQHLGDINILEKVKGPFLGACRAALPHTGSQFRQAVLSQLPGGLVSFMHA